MSESHGKKKQALANALIQRHRHNVKLIRNFSDDEFIEVKVPEKSDTSNRFSSSLSHLSNQEKLRCYANNTEGKITTKKDLVPVTNDRKLVKNRAGDAAGKVTTSRKKNIELDLRKTGNENPSDPRQHRYIEYKVHERKPRNLHVKLGQQNAYDYYTDINEPQTQSLVETESLHYNPIPDHSEAGQKYTFKYEVKRNRIFKNIYNDDYVLADIGNPDKETTKAKESKSCNDKISPETTESDNLIGTQSLNRIKELSNYLKSNTPVKLLNKLQSRAVSKNRKVTTKKDKVSSKHKKPNCDILMMDMKCCDIKLDESKSKKSKTSKKRTKKKSPSIHAPPPDKVSGGNTSNICDNLLTDITDAQNELTSKQSKEPSNSICSSKQTLKTSTSIKSSSKASTNKSSKRKDSIKSSEHEGITSRAINSTLTNFVTNSDIMNCSRKSHDEHVTPAEKSARDLISAFQKYHLHHPDTKITADKFNKLLSSTNHTSSSNHESRTSIDNSFCNSNEHPIDGIQSMPIISTTRKFTTINTVGNMSDVDCYQNNGQSKIENKVINAGFRNECNQIFELRRTETTSTGPIFEQQNHQSSSSLNIGQPSMNTYSAKSTRGDRVSSNISTVDESSKQISSDRYHSTLFSPIVKEDKYERLDGFIKKNSIISGKASVSGQTIGCNWPYAKETTNIQNRLSTPTEGLESPLANQRRQHESCPTPSHCGSSYDMAYHAMQSDPSMLHSVPSATSNTPVVARCPATCNTSRNYSFSVHDTRAPVPLASSTPTPTSPAQVAVARSFVSEKEQSRQYSKTQAFSVNDSPNVYANKRHASLGDGFSYVHKTINHNGTTLPARVIQHNASAPLSGQMDRFAEPLARDGPADLVVDNHNQLGDVLVSVATKNSFNARVQAQEEPIVRRTPLDIPQMGYSVDYDDRLYAAAASVQGEVEEQTSDVDYADVDVKRASQVSDNESLYLCEQISREGGHYVSTPTPESRTPSESVSIDKRSVSLVYDCPIDDVDNSCQLTADVSQPLGDKSKQSLSSKELSGFARSFEGSQHSISKCSSSQSQRNVDIRESISRSSFSLNNEAANLQTNEEHEFSSSSDAVPQELERTSLKNELAIGPYSEITFADEQEMTVSDVYSSNTITESAYHSINENTKTKTSEVALSKKDSANLSTSLLVGRTDTQNELCNDLETNASQCSSLCSSKPSETIPQSSITDIGTQLLGEGWEEDTTSKPVSTLMDDDYQDLNTSDLQVLNESHKIKEKLRLKRKQQKQLEKLKEVHRCALLQNEKNIEKRALKRLAERKKREILNSERKQNNSVSCSGNVLTENEKIITDNNSDVSVDYENSSQLGVVASSSNSSGQIIRYNVLDSTISEVNTGYRLDSSVQSLMSTGYQHNDKVDCALKTNKDYLKICNEFISESDMQISQNSSKNFNPYQIGSNNDTHDTVYNSFKDEHDTTRNISIILSGHNASYVSDACPSSAQVSSRRSKLATGSESLTSCIPGHSRSDEVSDNEDHSELTSSPLSEIDSLSDIALVNETFLDSWQESNCSSRMALSNRISVHTSISSMLMHAGDSVYDNTIDDIEESTNELEKVESTPKLNRERPSEEERKVIEDRIFGENRRFENKDMCLETLLKNESPEEITNLPGCEQMEYLEENNHNEEKEELQEKVEYSEGIDQNEKNEELQEKTNYEHEKDANYGNQEGCEIKELLQEDVQEISQQIEVSEANQYSEESLQLQSMDVILEEGIRGEQQEIEESEGIQYSEDNCRAKNTEEISQDFSNEQSQQVEEYEEEQSQDAICSTENTQEITDSQGMEKKQQTEKGLEEIPSKEESHRVGNEEDNLSSAIDTDATSQSCNIDTVIEVSEYQDISEIKDDSSVISQEESDNRGNLML